jgi:hypothetical protein
MMNYMITFLFTAKAKIISVCFIQNRVSFTKIQKIYLIYKYILDQMNSKKSISSTSLNKMNDINSTDNQIKTSNENLNDPTPVPTQVENYKKMEKRFTRNSNTRLNNNTLEVILINNQNVSAIKNNVINSNEVETGTSSSPPLVKILVGSPFNNKIQPIDENSIKPNLGIDSFGNFGVIHKLEDNKTVFDKNFLEYKAIFNLKNIPDLETNKNQVQVFIDDLEEETILDVRFLTTAYFY